VNNYLVKAYIESQNRLKRCILQ